MQVGTRRAGLVLPRQNESFATESNPPPPTTRSPQETVEAAPESSRRALQMSNLTRPTDRSPKEAMSDRAERTPKRRTPFGVLHGFKGRSPSRSRTPRWKRARRSTRQRHLRASSFVFEGPSSLNTEYSVRKCPVAHRVVSSQGQMEGARILRAPQRAHISVCRRSRPMAAAPRARGTGSAQRRRRRPRSPPRTGLCLRTPHRQLRRRLAVDGSDPRGRSRSFQRLRGVATWASKSGSFVVLGRSVFHAPR